MQRKIALIVGAILIGVIGGVYGVSTALTIDSSAESLELSGTCTTYEVVLSLHNVGQTAITLVKYQNTWNTGQSPVYPFPSGKGDLSVGQTESVALTGEQHGGNFTTYITTARGHVLLWISSVRSLLFRLRPLCYARPERQSIQPSSFL